MSWSRTRSAGACALALAAAFFAAGCDDEPLGEPNPRVREVVGTGESPVLSLPDGDTLHLSAPVAAFYRERGYRQAWTDYDEVLDRGLALLEAMGSSDEDGLDPQRYRYGTAARLLRLVEEDSLPEEQEPSRMADVDMVLSEVFARYARHLTAGMLDPRAEDLDWRIERDSADVGALLARLAEDEADPAELVEELRPAVPEYRRMMEAYARYRAVEEAGGWPEVPEAGPFEVGDSDPAVGVLRRRLIAERDPEEARLARRGEASPNVFDQDLKAALERFQRRHGLRDDGALGEATRAALNVPAAERAFQVQVNLDRWRWLPRSLGERYVLVNVAGFEMEVVENDSAIMTMNVVVGKEGHHTPIFRDTMEYIVVNPYWNVPSSIAAEEIAPVAMRDPGYIDRNDYEVLQGGSRVSPYAVNWASIRSGGSAYRIRQRPGPQNALGQVKFLFPNDDDIYLHDTPADHLFSESSRAFSHGCIRVERPDDLARLLLARATDVPPERYDDLRAARDEKWIKLDEPIPVYILYFTAWADRDGAVRFYDDVYGRDETIEPKAREQFERVAAR